MHRRKTMRYVLPLALCAIACVQQSAETPRPAAQVPTHALTLENAGSLTEAEQGDWIEIRLDPAQWRLTRQTGGARLELSGEIKSAFRYRAAAVGESELTFTGAGQQTATFRFAIR
jgi:hypothetical protein